MNFSVKDYPLAEKHPEKVKGARGKQLSEITLASVLDGTVTIEDLRITPAALLAQAEVAGNAGRPRLAENFLRSAEMVLLPQDLVMRIYELLRPGRAKSKAELDAIANRLRKDFAAERLAAFIEEAASVYEARGLFSKRF